MNLRKFSEINIIPLIDILLVLIAIVLTTAVFTQQNKIKVDLPVVENKSNISSTDLEVKSITVKDDNQIYLDDNLIDLNSLEISIKDWNNNMHINLRIDKKAEFQGFVNIVNLLKQQKLTNINIITIGNK